MTKIDVPKQTYNSVERVAKSLDGFEETEELILYILSEFCREIDGEINDKNEQDVNEDDIEERLEDLGYL